MISENLKVLRKSKGMTQKEAAGDMFSIRVYQKWESGESEPSVGNAYKLAKRFGVTLEELINGKEAMTEFVGVGTEFNYQVEAAKFINMDLDKKEMKMHALYGMASEVGELLGIFQKVYQGHEADEEHIKKELGDALWMITEFCTANGWKLEDIEKMNITKLSNRYPNGFEAIKSLHRVEGDI